MKIAKTARDDADKWRAIKMRQQGTKPSLLVRIAASATDEVFFLFSVVLSVTWC